MVSSLRNITCGVPQGSILGPLLFFIYINDLATVIRNCKIFLYADDTVLVATGSVIHNVYKIMQTDLDKISEWCVSNKLTVNVKKTKALLLGTRSIMKRNNCQPLALYGQSLDHISYYKYRGMTLDSSLSFNKHVNNVIQSVAHKIYMLGKIRPYITNNACIQIYKSMILPYIDYGDIIYASTNQLNLRKIQSLQNRCLKICLGLRHTTPTQILCSSAQVAPLNKRRTEHLRNYMFKNKTNDELIDSRPILTRARDGPIFKVTKPNLEIYKESCLYRGVIRNIDSFNTFKSIQKNWMLTL